MKSPAKKPSTTIPDLTNYPEVELLRMAASIFTAMGEITEQQKDELAAIDREFERRDSLLLLGR